MKHLDLLQEYISNSAVLSIKMHNIHWNVVGLQFVKIHNFTEELYDKLLADLDEVAELLKMKGEMPLSTMADYLERATIKEVPAKDFAIKESLTIIKEDLETMKQLVTDIRNLADEEGDFETVAVFEDYAAFYSKYLWFVNAMTQ